MNALDDSASRTFDGYHTHLLQPAGMSIDGNAPYSRSAPLPLPTTYSHKAAPATRIPSVDVAGTTRKDLRNEAPVANQNESHANSSNDNPVDDFEGDTQPMPSQIYKDYQSRIDLTADTVRMGDAGHVDLLSGFAQDETQRDAQSRIDLDHDDTAMMEDTQGSLLSSVTRPQYMPRTPAMRGPWRDPHGEELSAGAALDTPDTGLTNLLGTMKRPTITNSQLFAMTQGPLSPLQHDPRSDPGDERPSPDFDRRTAIVTSPPSALKRAASSPVKVDKPHERYTSMDESQKRRNSSHDGLRSNDAPSTRVTFDTDDSSYGERLPAHAFSKGRLAGQNVRSMNGVVARSMNGKSDSLPSPSKSVINISDDGQSSPVQSVDEYDEFSEAVIRSQRPETLGDTSPCPSSHNSAQQIDNSTRSIAEPSQQQEMDSVILDSQPPVSRTVDTGNTESQAVKATQNLSSSTHLPPVPRATQLRASVDVQSTPPVPESSDVRASRTQTIHITNGEQPSTADSAALEHQSTDTINTSLHKQSSGTIGIAAATEADSAAHYETARSQSPRPTPISQPSYDSPRKAAGVRRMADIAEDPSTSDPANMIMSSDMLQNLEVLTKDDREFLDIVQPAPRQTKRTVGYGKRRKGASAKGVSEAAPPKFGTGDLSHQPPSEDQIAPSTTPSKETEEHSLSHSKDESMPATRPRAQSKRKRNSADAGMSVANAATKRPRRLRSSTPQLLEDLPMHDDAVDQGEIVATIKPANPTTPTRVSPQLAEVVDAHASSSGPQTWDPRYRHRVLAPFRGTKPGVFPATCTAMLNTIDSGKCIVRFDDENEDKLEPHLVGAFDLHKGDLIKVDERNSKNKTFVVCGLSKRIDASGDFVCTDVHGNTHVTLAVRPRDSKVDQATEMSETRVVSLAHIYLTNTMWPKFHDRTYQAIGHLLDIAPGFRPPSNDTSAQVTPRGKGRRDTLDQARSLPALLPMPIKSGIFTNMAFALTFFEDSAGQGGHIKRTMIDTILSHGGQVIDHLSGLFEASGTTCLTLAKPASSLGFVALITDRHSRREKYIQALALGLPCLSHRWVTACVQAGQPVSWERYLLAAGESKLIDAVRSRVLPFSPVANTKLSEIIARRDRLLDNGGVLIIPPKTAKDRERISTFTFLTYALGAERVQMVSNLEEAVGVLSAEPNRWVWVHYEDASQQALHSFLHGTKAKVKTSGSKVEDGAMTAKFGKVVSRGDLAMSAKTEKCRFVTKEFVIQSIILGALVED